MNDEEVVYSSEQEQEQQQVQKKPRKSIKETYDDAVDTVRDVGKTVENVGKIEEKAADFIEGGKKATDVATTAGKTTSSTVEAGSKAAGATAKATEAAGQATEAAGKATKAAGKATKAAGTATKAAGEATSSVGDAANTIGTAADATGVGAVAGVPLNVAGTAASVGGKIAAGTGQATEAAGQATEAAGEATEAAGKATKEAGKAGQAAAKAAETGSKAVKEGSNLANEVNKNNNLSDKLRQRGKLNQARGKRIQEMADKFDTDKFFKDKFKNLKKGADGLKKIIDTVISLFNPITICVITLLLIILGEILISYILSPMFFMAIIKGTVGNPDNIEKVNNYIAGLGLQDSKEAFYDEVSYLTVHYGDEIDFPYIMSTLYYTDIYYGDNSFYTEDNSNVCTSLNLDDEDDAQLCGYIQIGINLAKAYIKETKETTGDDGLVYSANKLYRLRNLAKHQFLGKKKIEEDSLPDYLDLCMERMANEFKNITDMLPYLIFYAIVHLNPVTGQAYDNIVSLKDQLGDLYDILDGTENFYSLQKAAENGKGDEISEALTNLLITLFNSFFEIKDVDFDTDEMLNIVEGIFLDANGDALEIDSFDDISSEVSDAFGDLLECITIEYYDYDFNEEEYENYLVDEYIRYMPEFSKLLLDKDGNRLTGDDLEEKINQIASEIKLAKDLFDSIYETEESAQDQNKCIGDIDLNLLSELVPPVNLTIGQTITFYGSNNYGVQMGIIHNGLDLDEDSTGTKEGDEVFSIYDGKVARSTVDGTYNEVVNGGWLAIDYTIQYTNNSLNDSKISNLFKNKLSKIRVYYGGLNPDTLTLKQGDIVSKGQVIGNVGNASMSETGEKPSLHFGIHDSSSGSFLNPVNMFITCNATGGSGDVCYYNASGGVVYDIPEDVLTQKQINYDVECYSADKGYGCTEKKAWLSGSNQEKVQQLWISSGAQYTNGIATVEVNGEARYLAATTQRFGQVGDLIDATLENGEVIHIIIDDEKDYCDTNISIANKTGKACKKDKTLSNQLIEVCKNSSTEPGCFGHFKGNKGVGVLEFGVNPDVYNNNPYPSPSKWGQVWDVSQKVVSITNYGSILGETNSNGLCEINPASNTYVGNLGTEHSINGGKTGTSASEHYNTGSSSKTGTNYNEHSINNSGKTNSSNYNRDSSTNSNNNSRTNTPTNSRSN